MPNNVIPPDLAQSVGLMYVVSKGFSWRESGGDQITVEVCPFCKHDEHKFYMCVKGNKDGVFMCHHCSKSGNLRSLQEELGDRIAGVSSSSKFGGQTTDKKVEPLPDVDKCHQALMEDDKALDYLVNERGFTMKVIEQQKLGVIPSMFFRKTGEVKALVIPYLVNGNCVWAKYRTLPPAPKDFDCPSGWEAALYNGEIIKPGLEEIIFVEGEADVLSCLSNGISNVVGVPGANTKKANWITQLDEIKPNRIYILYDSDRVGQKGAQALAARIGIERCLKLVLPDFEIEGEAGVFKKGKDVSEWLLKGGGSVEAFENLKKNAKQFDVLGVSNMSDALDEFEQQLEGKETLRPTYDTPWESVNKKVGFEDGDVIDIVAAEKVGKTTFGMNLMDYAVDKFKEPGIIICLEMTQARLARKWVSMVTETNDSPATSYDDSKEKLKNMKAAVVIARKKATDREAELYFAYPQIAQPEDLYELIRQCVRRYGVRWVMFDNLQLLCDTTLKNAAHRTIHLSQISKSLAKLAKDLQIKLLRIVQPKRVMKDRIADSDDVDGSSQIAKDCDCMILLHRQPMAGITVDTFKSEGFIESEGALEPKMLVNVRLSRYSGGGATTLEFVGECSKVREYDKTKKAELAPKTQRNHEVKREEPLTPKAAVSNAEPQDELT